MRRINSRGLAQANKHVLMADLSYNLKKYLKFNRKRPDIIAQSMTLMKGLLLLLENVICKLQISGYKPVKLYLTK
jgi:hypothetical protein